MVTVNITNKVFYLVVVFVGVLLVSGVVFAALNPTIPNPGHAVSEIQKCSDGESLTMVGGVWGCVDVGSGGSVSLVLSYNQDSATEWQCDEQDLEDYCGDADGCEIRTLVTDLNNDQTFVETYSLYMEQPATSPAKSRGTGVGLHGGTSMEDVEHSIWQNGAGIYHIMLDMHGFTMENGKHTFCGGTSTAYVNPYMFAFRVEYNKKATIVIYD